MLSLLALASSGLLLQSSLRVTDQGSARTAVVPRAHSRCSLTGFDAGWVRHDARFSKIGFDLIQVLNWNRKIAASADSATASADNVAASSNSVAGSSNTRRTGSPSVSASIFATGILMVGAQAGNPPWQHVASLLGAVAVAARGYYVAASSNSVAAWLEVTTAVATTTLAATAVATAPLSTAALAAATIPTAISSALPAADTAAALAAASIPAASLCGPNDEAERRNGAQCQRRWRK